MNIYLKDIIKHSIVAIIISILLSLLINWLRTAPNTSFQMAGFGVLVCIMLTLNYVRSWRIKYIDQLTPSWTYHIKKNWMFELMYFIIVNAAFVLPLIVFKVF